MDELYSFNSKYLHVNGLAAAKGKHEAVRIKMEETFKKIEKFDGI